MRKVLIHRTSPLRPFQVDLRDKERVRALLYKLNVNLVGWNLAYLLAKYHADVDASLSLERHCQNLIKLTAILISGDNNRLINDPSAFFSEKIANVDLFTSFVSQFIEELKKILCLDQKSPYLSSSFGSRSYAQELHGAMTSVIYAQMHFANPAVSAIAAFLLIILANSYPLNFCEVSTTEIASNLSDRLRVS